jgi:hypothetical protein
LPVQALLQQTPLTQVSPLAHCDEVVQPPPVATGMHVPLWQSPLWQSPPLLQPWPSGHLGQEPPQSLPVSLPSFVPSPQLDMHCPLVQMLGGPEQSPVVTQPTQLPLPSQTLPPPLLHWDSAAELLTTQVLLVHTTDLQVPGSWQSLVLVQPTHLPMPSQIWLLPPQLWPCITLAMVTIPIEQPSVTQGLPLMGTFVSSGTVITAPPMHCSVVQLPCVGVKPGGVVPSMTLVWVHVPVVQVSVVHAFMSSHWLSIMQPVVPLLLDVVPEDELIVPELPLVEVAPPVPWDDEKKPKFWVQATGTSPKEPRARARIVA